MGAATLTIFAAVLHRYAAGLRIPGLQERLLALDFSWAQELCIFMFVWMCKFGAAYGVRTGIHVGVDVLVNRLPPPWRTAGGDRSRSRAAFSSPASIGALGARFVWEGGLHYALASAAGIRRRAASRRGPPLRISGGRPGSCIARCRWARS